MLSCLRLALVHLKLASWRMLLQLLISRLLRLIGRRKLFFFDPRLARFLDLTLRNCLLEQMLLALMMMTLLLLRLKGPIWSRTLHLRKPLFLLRTSALLMELSVLCLGLRCPLPLDLVLP